MLRNEVFAHRSKASFPETEFQRCVSKLSNAFTSRHLSTVELQRIINQKCFPTWELHKLQEQVKALEDEIQGKAKPFMTLPQAPSHEIFERKVEVEDIMKKFSDLQTNNKNAYVVTICISGNPGCGKSQVASQVGRQFFQRECDKNDHDSLTLVMTFNAESELSLLDSYYKFTLKVGVTEYSLNSITGGDSVLLPNEKICYLKTLISAKMTNYSSWLLMYDNVDEFKGREDILTLNDWLGRGDYLPNEHWGGCGHVLVTTQDIITQAEADPLCESVSLSKGMQSEDARNLLRKICQLSCHSEKESLVLNALDYQPLAIACAAIYLGYVGVDRKTSSRNIWEDYLAKLETLKRRASTEKAYEWTSRYYRSSMIAAVTLALKKLVQEPIFEQVVSFLVWVQQRLYMWI